MIEEDIDDEYLDDPIRLFDSEQNRVFFRPLTKEVVIEDSDDADDTGFKKKQIEQKETMYSYETNSSILPVSFFDIDSNVELLKQCRPLCIKLVDCDKYPWYCKKNTGSSKHNNLNSDKTILQEADCIEIMSSDENYDLILERTTLEDISNINKELNRIRFESENKSMVKQTFEKMMRKEHKRNSFNNNNNIDLKRNKGVIGLKISQTNFMIDAKSDENKANLLIYDSSNFEDTYVDKIGTYARLIDIAYQKLQNENNKPPALTEHETYIKTDKGCGKHQNKFKTNENPRNIKLDDQKPTKNNLNDCTKIKSHVSPQLLKSSNKNKITNVIIEESQLKDCTRDNNNGSSSPLLPCPTHINNNNNPKITIISDTTFPSNPKQNIKKNNVCKNHLFSANRVIPHYHNELMQVTKKIKSSKVSQDISKHSTENNDVLQTHFAYPACKVNDFYPNNQSVLKEYNNKKQNRLIDVNVSRINNLTYNNNFESNTNRISSLNRSAPTLSTGQCTSHPNLSQELITHEVKRGKERSIQPEVAKSVSLVDATKGSNNHPVPVINNIPVLLRQKPQPTNQNNVKQATFPIQRIISNRDRFKSNNIIVTPEYSNDISTVNQCIQNLSKKNIYPNHINNDSYTSENSISVRTKRLQNPANFYGFRAPSLNVKSQQPLNATNRLTQINNSQIPNTNIKYHHYINDHENILSINNATKNKMTTGNKNNISRQTIAASLATDVNHKTSTAVENTKRNVVRGTSAYADKHPHLKQSLEEPPLKMNKTNAMNMRTDQQICRNNDDGIKLKHNTNKTENKIRNDNVNKNITLLSNGNASNVNKETMIAALLATAYVNQKASGIEENSKYKVRKEASPRVDNTHLKKSLKQLPLKSKTDFTHTENNNKIDQNNIISIKPVSKGYSPPILPIPTYQKTFEILAKIKLYDLEKDSKQPEPNNIIGVSASENLRKRKIGETEKVSRKITINEYKKRLAAMERVSLEDNEVNIL